MFNFVFSGKRRSSGLRQLAETIGLQFSETAEKATTDLFEEFSLFSQGYGKKFANLLSGKYQNVPSLFFDYRYTTGSGDSAHTAIQTVAAFQSDSLKLPRFSLRPENIFDRVGEFLGRKDIDFSSFPKFSKQYFLKGVDPESIRRTFADWVVSYYELHTGICTEGNGSTLIFYRAGKTVPAEKMEQFIQEGFEIFNLFRKH